MHALHYSILNLKKPQPNDSTYWTRYPHVIPTLLSLILHSTMDISITENPNNQVYCMNSICDRFDIDWCVYVWWFLFIQSNWMNNGTDIIFCYFMIIFSYYYYFNNEIIMGCRGLLDAINTILMTKKIHLIFCISLFVFFILLTLILYNFISNSQRFHINCWYFYENIKNLMQRFLRVITFDSVICLG